MTGRLRETDLKVFATCPPSYNATPRAYLRDVLDVASWSEAAGCEGILIYTDNGLVDPWLIAQEMITHTQRLCPLVAVQPAYMHPYAVAKIVASLAFLHGRRVYLNMVAGGFKNDLLALNDTTPHDDRYAKLIEYTTIIKLLLSSHDPVSFAGKFYKVEKLRMSPPLAAELFPGLLISGSSDAGLAGAKSSGAVGVQYPKPAKDCERIACSNGLEVGARIGIIARERSADAWAVAC